MSLKSRTVLTIALSAILPLLAIGSFLLYEMSSLQTHAVYEHLRSVAKLKQHALVAELSAVNDSIKGLAQDPNLAAALQDPDYLPAATQTLHSIQESNWGRLHHIFAVNAEGHVVVSPPHGDSTATHLGEGIEHPDLPKALAGQSVITDFFGFAEKDHFHQLIMQPIHAADGRVIGAVVAEVTIAHQLKQLALDEELGESSEVILLTLDGQRIVHSAKERGDQIHNELLTASLTEGFAEGPLTDEHGKSLVGVYLHESDFPWVMAMHIDESVAFAAVRQAFTVTIAAVLIVSVLVSFLAYIVARHLLAPIQIITNRMRDISEGEGDLTQRVELNRNDELGQLAGCFNQFVDRIQELMRQVSGAGQQVNLLASEISELSGSTSSEMNDQASRMIQIAAAVEEMSASAGEIANRSGQAATSASESGDQAQAGRNDVSALINRIQTIDEVVGQGATTAQKLGERAEQIGTVVQVINEIADQTNLLALNAAIEAARAGEHGRGFAVVADEVRKLADRTTVATQEISESITAIQQDATDAVSSMSEGAKQVRQGVTEADTSGECLGRIVEASTGVQEMVASIAAAADQQSEASSTISSDVDALASSAERAKEAANQSSTVAADLSSQAQSLEQLLSRFKLEAD